MYQTFSWEKVFLPYRHLLCEAFWGKGYLENKYLTMVFFPFSWILLHISKEARTARSCWEENIPHTHACVCWASSDKSDWVNLGAILLALEGISILLFNKHYCTFIGFECQAKQHGTHKTGKRHSFMKAFMDLGTAMEIPLFRVHLGSYTLCPGEQSEN